MNPPRPRVFGGAHLRDQEEAPEENAEKRESTAQAVKNTVLNGMKLCVKLLAPRLLLRSEKIEGYIPKPKQTGNNKKGAGVVSHRPRARPRPFQKTKADKKQNVPRVEGGTNQKQIFCIIRGSK